MKIRASRTTMLAMALLCLGTGCDRQAGPSQGRAADVQTAATTSAVDDEESRRSRFDATMQRHGIPGAQLVRIHHGVREEYVYGVMSKASGGPVTGQTVFEAASLSKVVAAYVTLRLADQGRIDLDAPLWSYWHSPRTEGDAAARTITARMVLDHTTGLPNWQISPTDPALDSTPLAAGFAPGTRFQYSGEGFYLLQKTLEHITGLDWNALARQEAFAPLDMPSSSYLTDPALDGVRASGHAKDGTVRPVRVFAKGNTAWTLVTNASDYANFVRRALYAGEGLAPATHALMFAEASDADDRDVPTPADPFVAWGLGVGLQTTAAGKRVWHWGDNPGFKAFFMLDPETGDSVVLFTNSENGLAAYKDVLEAFLGEGEYPAVDWARAQS